MDDGSPERLRARALALVGVAFADRPAPASLTDSMQLSDAECQQVMSFDAMTWQDVGFQQVQRCSDAVFWLSPEAFCYFLPGLLTASLREGSLAANAYEALIGMLDRSPEPAFWDDFFAPRWTLLSPLEVEAVAAWVDWFEALEPAAFYQGTFDRARGTLRLLRERIGGRVPRVTEDEPARSSDAGEAP